MCTWRRTLPHTGDTPGQRKVFTVLVLQLNSFVDERRFVPGFPESERDGATWLFCARIDYCFLYSVMWGGRIRRRRKL